MNKLEIDRYRLCEVNGKIGYFHRWAELCDVISPSPMIGGHPGGIVEFPDEVREVTPSQIKFRDVISAELKAAAKAINDMKL